jgi:hypothetical protein
LAKVLIYYFLFIGSLEVQIMQHKLMTRRRILQLFVASNLIWLTPTKLAWGVTRVITTKEELEKAIDQGDQEIIIEGELAKQIHDSQSLQAMDERTITSLGAAVGSISVSGSLSTVWAPIISALTGTPLNFVIALIVMGFELLLGFWGQYDEIEFDAGNPPRLILRRKGKYSASTQDK